MILILSAYEDGLVASFIGAFEDEKVAKVLGLLPDRSIVPLAVIPLGYKSSRESAMWHSTSKAQVKGHRGRLADVVHWDKW